MSDWTRDLALGGRSIVKRPFFSAMIVGTLGLGVGTVTALFGVFRAVYLEPLPIPEPDEVVVVMEGSARGGCCSGASGPDYVDWRERQRAFSEIAAFSPRSMTLTGLGAAERVYATLTTASAFPLVGLPPLLGRWLVDADERPDDAQVVVLSHHFWIRAFGADSAVIGRSIDVEGLGRTVVGVMPPDFDIPSPWGRGRQHEFYLPLSRAALEGPRDGHRFPVAARLASGSSLASAQADMEGIVREIEIADPALHAGRRARVFRLHEYLFGEIGDQLLLMLGAAGLVLVIACGNVAGLQIARATVREGELAVRTALGASRGALMRLLFSESLLLAGLGGVLGVALARLAVGGLGYVLPPSIPRADAVAIAPTDLIVAVAMTGFAALAFGVLPAFLAARGPMAAAVKEAGYGTRSQGKERVRDLFIVLQIALGLVLVNGAGLLVRSYATLRAQDQGFDADGVLTFSLSPTGPRYDTAPARQALFDQVIERIGALRGVRSASMVSKLPLNGGQNGSVWIEGRPRPVPGQATLVEVSSVVGAYFEVMGIPLLAGRTLVPDDSATASVGVVINETLAEVGWPGESPIGRRLSLDTEAPDWLTVVGVVGSVRQWRPEDPILSEIYLPYSKGWARAGYIAARLNGDPLPLVEEIRAAVATADPALPAVGFRTMTDVVENDFAQRRLYTTLLGLFGGIALLLAAAGIYGTVSYYVALRTREFSIRMSLGSGGLRVVALVLRRGGRLALSGVMLGTVGAWLSASLIDTLVYGVAAWHLPTVALGALSLVCVVLLGSWLPARRAAAVSPMTALRAE